jgi:hypothetical protein
VQPSTALVWDSAEIRPACDRTAQLRNSVAVYLGRDAFEENAPLMIRVRLRRAAGSSTIIADVSRTDAEGLEAALDIWSAAGGDLFKLTFTGPKDDGHGLHSSARLDADRRTMGWIAESNRGQTVAFAVSALRASSPTDVWSSRVIAVDAPGWRGATKVHTAGM